MPDVNPYEPPQTPLGPPPVPDTDPGDPLTIRRAHLRDESAVWSVGKFLVGSALLVGAVFVLMALAATDMIQLSIRPRGAWFVAVGCLVVGPILGLLGAGLIRLQRWALLEARVFLCLLVIIGLFWMIVQPEYMVEPGLRLYFLLKIPPIVLGHCLVARLAPPSRDRVCQRDYRAVVQATPEVSCPWDVWVKVLFWIMAPVAVVALAQLSPANRPWP